MIRKTVSLILVISFAFSCLTFISHGQESENYGSIKVYYIENRKNSYVDVMVRGDNVYVEASFYKQFGFEIVYGETAVVIGNNSEGDIPTGALGFYYDSTECCRVNSAISKHFNAPFETIKSDEKAWIPFEYSMTMLNGSILLKNDTLMISAPRQSILDVMDFIAQESERLRFEYAKDFGYNDFQQFFLGEASHLVNLFNGLLTFDGASWISFMDTSIIANKVLGDLGYDKKYGYDIAKMVCTYSQEELVDAVENIGTLADVMDENGALGEFFEEVTLTADKKIGDLYDESRELLDSIKKGNGSIGEYNRVYNQLEDAMDKARFLDVGDAVVELQKSASGVASGLQIFSLITESVAYINEFEQRDMYAVDSLETFANELPDFFGEVSFYVKEAMLGGAKTFRKNAASYAVGEYLENNLGNLISQGLPICTGANLALLAWDLISGFVPFISDGLSAADKYELSIYAMSVQNEAWRVYNEKLNEMIAGDKVNEEGLKELAQYAFVYLKMCYVTRNAALGGLHVFPIEEYEDAAETVKGIQNRINLSIIPKLNILKNTVNSDEFAFLYASENENVLSIGEHLVKNGEYNSNNKPAVDEASAEFKCALDDFVEMIKLTDEIWSFPKKYNFETMPVSEIIDDIILNYPYVEWGWNLYSYYGFESPGTMPDSEDRFYPDAYEDYDALEFDTEGVHWILENVFGRTPDYKAGEWYYYIDKKICVKDPLGIGWTGDGLESIALEEYSNIGGNKYELIISGDFSGLRHVNDELERVPGTFKYKFVASLKRDDEGKLYWQLHEYEQLHRD